MKCRWWRRRKTGHVHEHEHVHEQVHVHHNVNGYVHDSRSTIGNTLDNIDTMRTISSWPACIVFFWGEQR